MRSDWIPVFGLGLILATTGAASAGNLQDLMGRLRDDRIEAAGETRQGEADSLAETVAAAPARTVGPVPGGINSQNARLRQQPSLTAPIEMDLNYGTRVTVIGEQGEWLRVRTADGTVGWIARFLVEQSPDSPILREIPYSTQALQAAAATYGQNYRKYQTDRSEAAYEAFNQAYYRYRRLAMQSPEYCRALENPASLSVVVDKSDFTLTVYADGKPVREFPVAYGENPDGADKQREGDLRTPEGDFRINDLARMPYEGKGVATRWMGLGTKWSGIGLHGTPWPRSIGTRASHGCVRMFSEDSVELYRLVRMGTPVTIRQ